MNQFSLFNRLRVYFLKKSEKSKESSIIKSLADSIRTNGKKKLIVLLLFLGAANVNAQTSINKSNVSNIELSSKVKKRITKPKKKSSNVIKIQVTKPRFRIKSKKSFKRKIKLN